jgi:hypothetical protein
MKRHRSRWPVRAALVAGIATVTAHAATAARPARPPVQGCVWEEIADGGIGLDAWVQRCDFGFRRIDFLFANGALAVRYSDGGAPDPLIDVIALMPDETPEAGIRRVFAARTAPALAARCVLAPFRAEKAPAGVSRYTFVPDAAYAKELAAKADPNEVGDPPCGDYGDMPDGIQYFEAHPASAVRKVLFVRIGQDEPLFDEATLRLIAPAANASAK